MKQVTLNIKDSKFQFFMELVKNFDFIQVDPDGDSKEEVMANLKQGFKEMKLYKERKKEGTPLNDFLNEL